MNNFNISNKDTFYFSLIHYFVLALHICRGLFLAKYLGATGFGLYGLVLLAQQQISASALGMREAITLKLSGEDEQSKDYISTINSTLIFTIFVGFLLLISGFISFFEKERLSNVHPIGEYLYFICFHGVFSISSEVIRNILRIKGKILYVGVIDLIYGLSIICWALIIIFFEKDLFTFFTLSLVTNICIFFIYFYEIFNLLNLKFQLRKIFNLISLGFPLLILNVSTILMISIGQWIVGFQDNLYNLGLFGFAVSIASIVNHGLGSITWAYFSSMIAEYKVASKNRVSELSRTIRGYLFVCFIILLIFTSFLYSYFIEVFFKEYESTYFIFLMIFYSQFIQLFSYPDNALLLARKKINQVSMISIFSCLFMSTLSIFIYNNYDFFSLIFFQKIELISIIIFLGNLLYMIGVLRLSRAYKEKPQDLNFLIYLCFHIVVFLFFQKMNMPLISVLILIFFLVIFHRRSSASLFRILKDVF